MTCRSNAVLPQATTARRIFSYGCFGGFRLRRATIVWLGLILLCGTVSGCSRGFWRSQADYDSYNILLQKTADPRWDVPRIAVDPDPRSRFYDVYDADQAPIPPDDPAAYRYMQVADGMLGYQGWHKFGTLMSVENPHWLANFDFEPEELPPLDNLLEESPPVVTTSREVPTIRKLTLPQAIELANIHSRDYQTEIENVYLSALALTFDQFQFNVRYLGLGGAEPGGALDYEHVPGVSDNVRLGTRFGVSQLLPTGGQWVAELANNTLWLFNGPNQTNSASLLSFTLVQPLLFGAGRKVVLEDLTQSERQVLYDVRDLARFRRVFFGDTVVNGPGGGYLGILRQQQLVANQRDNIQSLAVQLDRLYAVNAQDPFEALAALPVGMVIPEELATKLVYDAPRQRLYWKGSMTEGEREQLMALSSDAEFTRVAQDLASRARAGTITLDLAQLLTRLSDQQNNLRNAERLLADAIDEYKLQLGLPTDFQLTLDASLLASFQLIDQRLNAAEQTVLDFAQRLEPIDLDEPDPAAMVRAATALQQLVELVQRDGMDLIDADFDRVNGFLPERLSRVDEEKSRDQVLRNLERDGLLYRGTRAAYEKLVEQSDDLLATLTAGEIDLSTRRQSLSEIRRTRERLLLVTQTLKVLQVGLRSELITLQEFEGGLDEVVQTAIDQRLDLMNARAQVMDARRQMEVDANRLQAVVDVVARADVGTSGGNRPFDFRGDQSTYQAGLRFTAPLDQVAERNNYRESQIAYQRARRAYLELEDNIKLDVRTQWRQLNVQRRNFETARQNLRYAAMQLDSAIENSNRPVPAGQTQVGGNQGLNLQNALQSVLNAQNNLIQIWILYEQNRINIHRDMDTMEVDERGMWLDPFYQSLSSPEPVSPRYPSLVEPADEFLLPPAPGVTSLGKEIGVDSAGPVKYGVTTHRAAQRGAAVAARTGPATPQNLAVDLVGRTGLSDQPGRVVLATTPGGTAAIANSVTFGAGAGAGRQRAVSDRGD